VIPLIAVADRHDHDCKALYTLEDVATYLPRSRYHFVALYFVFRCSLTCKMRSRARQLTRSVVVSANECKQYGNYNMSQKSVNLFIVWIIVSKINRFLIFLVYMYDLLRKFGIKSLQICSPKSLYLLAVATLPCEIQSHFQQYYTNMYFQYFTYQNY